MTVHLIKMAAGLDDVAQLRARQTRRLVPGPRGRKRLVRLRTRNTPRRAEEVLDGGSIYWVIRGVVRARQRVLSIERTSDREGRPVCQMGLDPNLVETLPRPCRAFQGWRYLPPADAPRDLKRTGAKADRLPAHLAAELHALGLI